MQVFEVDWGDLCFYNVSMAVQMLSNLLLISGLLGNPGSAGYSYLRIPVSVEEAIFGYGFAALKNANLNHYNPAILGMGGSFNLYGISYLAGVMAGGLSYNFGENMGITLFGVNSGAMTKTDTLGNELGTFSTNHIVLKGLYSKNVSKSVVAGLSLDLLYQGIDRYNAIGIGIDLGVKFEPGYMPVSIGAVIRHLGYELTPFDSVRVNPTPDLVLSGAYDVSGLEIGAGVSLSTDRSAVSIGAMYKVNRFISAGLGFNSIGLQANLGGGEDILNGWNAGIRINVRNITVGYAFTPWGPLGDIHRIEVSFGR